VWDERAGQDWQRKRVVYVRLKIFNEEGKNTVSTVDLPFRNNIFIEAVEGRTIQPDGSIVMLKKEDVREREIVRLSGLRVKAKTFTMPAVQPGSIVEYKYRETQFKQGIRYLKANMQHEYPVQKITFFVKPMSRDYVSEQMRVWPFNCQPSKLNLETNGFNSTYVEKVPAFKEEPLMPGEPNVRPWVLFLYMDGDRRDPAKYWEKVGKDSYNRMKLSLKLNDEIKQAAAATVANAKTDYEKVVALITYLRKNIKNVFDSSVSVADRAKFFKSMPKERERTSVEVFKSGMGFADEMNTLFAAMAQSAGLEARPVFVSNRDAMVFDPGMVDRAYFLPDIDMAVKLDNEWKMFDVSSRYLPPNMIGWREEGIRALLSDPKTPQFIGTPLSPPESSVSSRSAKLVLLDDGTLEGDVELAYTGHAAADRRSGFDGEAAEKRAESFKEGLLRRYPSSEVSEVKITGVDDTTQPLKYNYRIKIPNYGQRTGRRVLFAPFYFQVGVAPRFSASERKFEIHFPYAFHEVDVVSIQLPDGFALDNAEAPPGLNFGGPGQYKVSMRMNGGNVLKVVRDFTFGVGGAITFPAEVYSRLKQVFDEVHKRDGTLFSLKEAGNR